MPISKAAKPLLVLAALLAFAIGVGPARGSDRTDGVADTGGPVVTNPSGAGETLVVVVEGVYATEDDAREAASDVTFGHLQGFYVDMTDNYEVLGAYRRTRPPRLQVDCAAPPNDHAAAGCEQAGGRQQIWVTEPAQLNLTEGTTLDEGKWLTLTAFRTKRGAEEFLDMANAFAVEGLETLRVRKYGDAYVGLGQESHPDGRGPLTAPLPDQVDHQQ